MFSSLIRLSPLHVNWDNETPESNFVHRVNNAKCKGDKLQFRVVDEGDVQLPHLLAGLLFRHVSRTLDLNGCWAGKLDIKDVFVDEGGNINVCVFWSREDAAHERPPASSRRPHRLCRSVRKQQGTSDEDKLFSAFQPRSPPAPGMQRSLMCGQDRAFLAFCDPGRRDDATAGINNKSASQRGRRPARRDGAR